MASFSERIQATNDDGYYNNNFGVWHVNTVNIGKNVSGEDGFFRFSGVTIPQGATILSAVINITSTANFTGSFALRIKGIAEDNTASFSSDPHSRTRTAASVDWNRTDFLDEIAYDSPDITSIIQEIVNRAGWASGNALGIAIADVGSSANSANFYSHDDSTTKCALITITYSGVSPSASISSSPSASRSPSASISPSASTSPSSTPSPSAAPTHGAFLKVAKTGVNVLTNSDPEKFKFSSEYGTLKYFRKQTVTISFNAGAPDNDIAATGSYTHNLGYYPFCEVFVRVYIGSPSGNFEYVPFFGSGATVEYAASFKLTTTQIVLYGQINGVSSSVWNFEFLIFIYKNNLQLS